MKISHPYTLDSDTSSHRNLELEDQTHQTLRVFHSTGYNLNMTRISFSLISTALLLAANVNAQFNFFEQMFQGGGGQQRHEPQNVASDSSWYQENYDNGMRILLYCIKHN